MTPEDRANLRQYVVKLKMDGLSYGNIGSILGLSHQRAQQILAGGDRKQVHLSGLCPKCGLFSKSLHRHHPDYSKSDYVLLCMACHKREPTRIPGSLSKIRTPEELDARRNRPKPKKIPCVHHNPAHLRKGFSAMPAEQACAIAIKGGQTLVAQKGKEWMRQIAMKGVMARRDKRAARIV